MEEVLLEFNAGLCLIKHNIYAFYPSRTLLEMQRRQTVNICSFADLAKMFDMVNRLAVNQISLVGEVLNVSEILKYLDAAL